MGRQAIAPPAPLPTTVTAPSPVQGGASGSDRGPDTVLWSVLVCSSTPLGKGDSGTNLTLRMVDKATDERTGELSLDDWEGPREVVGADGVKSWYRRGTIRVPAKMKEPSAVLVTKHPSIPGTTSLDYLSVIDVVTPSTGWVRFPCHSWVSSAHGERVFFEGSAFLPKDTPHALRDDRDRELAILRGEGLAHEGDMRTYGYMVYDDLWAKTAADRPALGFTDASKALPYPRRIATAGRGKDFLPYDEQFNYSKQQGFEGDTLAGLAVALTRGLAALEPSWLRLLPSWLRTVLGPVVVPLSRLPFMPKHNLEFDEFQDVKDLYKDDKQLHFSEGALQEGGDEVAALITGPLSASDTGLSYGEQKQRKEAGEDPARIAPSSGTSKPPPPTLGDQIVRAGSTLFADNKSADLDDLLKYPTPKVEAHRTDMWAEDLEFGRQMLAGMNPCVITALEGMPEGCAIKPEHVDDDLARLAGSSFKDLLAQQQAPGSKPRLFLVDYWLLNAFWGEAPPPTPGQEEHVGRCLLFLDQAADGTDRGLVPLAIELLPRSRSTLGQKGGDVYSRYQLCGEAGSQEPGARPEAALWRLAKAVFHSIDSGYHQLVSHWLRCHACSEPFAIAMRRHLSIMHPVTKLMMPHFRYTLNINTNARSSLINEGGIIESAFTPGAYAMRLTSAAYGATWRFRTQALPEDLKARRMVGSKGERLLTDYPYADDGMDLWSAMEDYFTEYLSLYYKKPTDVAEDTELIKWWREVKSDAHPDIKFVVEAQRKAAGRPATPKDVEEEVWGFAGDIPDLTTLVRVLATIAWTTSAHHAAVNFGQYDYSALMLNSSSLVRRPIPKPDDPNAPAWQALVNSKDSKAQEKEMLTYLADFVSTLKVMTTVKLLSSHANDEQYLDELNEMVTDPEAVAANLRFINRMKQAQVAFLNRNADPARWTRTVGCKQALPYTLLYPGSGPGVTMQGVPYSVSI